VLPHPDKDCDFSARDFHLRHGRLVLQTYTGELLSDEIAVFMLEEAKQIIMHEAKGD
jgi:hypothetical protein